MLTIEHLICEYRANPLGIDVALPRFGWQLQNDQAGAQQAAYRLQAASTEALLAEGHADLWDSGEMRSQESTQIVYAGAKLSSRQRVYWQVTVWDRSGASATSAPAWFEMGLLRRRDWKAQWIGAALRGGARSMAPAPYLRKGFILPGQIVAARLYVTALGMYECSINGQRVSDDVFAPGWTDYHKRVQYNVYDVTHLLQTGENVLGAVLGDGWAVGHVGWAHRQQYVDRPRLLAQLEIASADGTVQTICSDRTWRHWYGPLLDNDLLMGEAYDARLEMPGWDSPGFDDRRWLPVERFEDSGAALVATNGPTVRRIQELAPLADPAVLSRLSRQRTIFDLGQNMVGRVRFQGTAPPGKSALLRSARVRNGDGNLYRGNLGPAGGPEANTSKGRGVEAGGPGRVISSQGVRWSWSSTTLISRMATSRYSSFFSSAGWSGLLPVSAALSAESPVSPSSGSAFDFLIFSDTLAIESDTLVFICSEVCLTCSDACLTDSEDFLTVSSVLSMILAVAGSGLLDGLGAYRSSSMTVA